MLSMLGTAIGLALLVAGGAALVRGASQIAARLEVSEMLVGLTLVAFGTSLPELVVNVLSGMRGETDLAFGNVVGSNITNVAFVLGLAAAITPIRIQSQIIRRELPLLLLATTVITVMALDTVFSGELAKISRSEAVVLLVLFLIFLYIVFLDILHAQAHEPLLSDMEIAPLGTRADSDRFRWVLVGAGILMLYGGGEMTVNNATTLADDLGVSKTVVGLFVVAIGTSLPELVTSVIAAMRGAPDLALGNVVGSNIFNTLVVLPSAGLFADIAIPRAGIGDLTLSLVLAAVIVPVFFLGNARLSRTAASGFLGVYLAYAVLRIGAG